MRRPRAKAQRREERERIFRTEHTEAQRREEVVDKKRFRTKAQRHDVSRKREERIFRTKHTKALRREEWLCKIKFRTEHAEAQRRE